MKNEFKLQPFQKKFIRQVEAKKYDTFILSMPRGNGKSFIAGHLVARALTPDDSLFKAGKECILLAASITQARIVYRFARDILLKTEHASDYSLTDNAMAIAIKHKPTNTALKVISSSAKTALGIVGCPLLIADEPGAWQNREGLAMWEAIETAQGKHDSPLKVILIGTLAPSMDGSWWRRLVDEGTNADTYVLKYEGRADRWDSLVELKRCNPLTKISPVFYEKLKTERKKAQADTRKKATFLSYRLNLPTADSSTMLLTLDEWLTACNRTEKDTQSAKPIVGLDLGGNRAWSAAVALWRSGRCDAFAYTNGKKPIEAQERSDKVSRGTYQSLVDNGSLLLEAGKSIPQPQSVLNEIQRRWGIPHTIICDRFKKTTLDDCIPIGCRVEMRVSRWSESTYDITALRSLVRDGELTPTPEAKDILTHSLSVSEVKNDDAGNTRLIKKASDNSSRDDVSAALVLAAGLYQRLMATVAKGESSDCGLIVV